MTAWFQTEVTTLAFCWRLERGDGVTLGFTSHDRDLDIGGFRFGVPVRFKEDRRSLSQAMFRAGNATSS